MRSGSRLGPGPLRVGIWRYWYQIISAILTQALVSLIWLLATSERHCVLCHVAEYLEVLGVMDSVFGGLLLIFGGLLLSVLLGCKSFLPLGTFSLFGLQRVWILVSRKTKLFLE